MNLQRLPTLVYGDILSVNRTPGNALSTLAFPKSKSSLWDPSPSGDVAGLHLCYYRSPHLRVLEKALRLAHRHTHQRNNPTLCCFFLGSISVDEDEEGVTLTLDRFDPGRDQRGTRVPSLLLPGDVVVPVEFVLHGDKDPSSLVRPSDLSLTFKALQQACSGGDVVDLSQLLGVRGQVSCSQQGDQLGFSLRWLAASCASGFDVVGVRPLPIIPTALARSLSGNPTSPTTIYVLIYILQCIHLKCVVLFISFLTMDQTRKLLLLLESDPKACSLPLVGVWLSGVVQPSNPQVWAWCLRFFHSSSLHDRVLSEQGWFLLVLYSAVPSQARFYQWRSAGKQSGHMTYLVLRCSQDLTLFKHVEPAEGHYLQADLCIDETTQTETLQGPSSRSAALNCFHSRVHDSGVEDEDLSPRPSPSPHAPTQQMRRVHPSVPELSLLVDASLPASPPSALPSTSSRRSSSLQPEPSLQGRPYLPSPPSALPSTSSRRSSSLQPEPSLQGRPYLPSTPAAPLSQSCAGFWTEQTPPTLILPQPSPESTSTPPGPSSCPRSSAHPRPGALQTSRPFPVPCSCLQPGRPPWEEGGAMPSHAYQILMTQEHQLRLLQAQIQMLLDTQARPQVLSGQTDGLPVSRPKDSHPSSPPPLPPTTASVAVETGASLFWRSRLSPPTTPGPDQPSSPLSIRLLQVSSRLQASLSDQEPPSSPSSSSSSPSYGAHSHRKQEVSEGDEKQLGVNLDLRPDLNTAQEASNPSLLPSLAQTPRDPLLPGDLSLAQTPRDPLLPGDLSLAQTPRDPLLPGDLSLAQTPRDPLLPGHLSLAQTPRDPLLPGHLSLAQTPRDPQLPGHLSLAQTPRDPQLPGHLSLTQISRDPLRPGGSVDLSLEANAIALRYLSDGQLARLSVGSQGGKAALGSPDRSVLTPSNMSLATRGYMRRYGLIEEEEEEEGGGLPCSMLGTESSLPQNQLIRDLQPKLRLLARSSRNQDQENVPVQQRGSLAAGSVGNFLDVSRLRQLPKLF
ncbi:unnamed protein product [Lota lota]